jgi:hypothetical protein
MDEDLLHQPAEKVLLLWLGPCCHHLLELVQKACKEFPVDGRDLHVPAPLLHVALSRSPARRSGRSGRLLRAAFRLQHLSLERREVGLDP